MKKINLLFLLFSLLFAACETEPDTDQLSTELFQTDIEFSEFSKSQGRNAAFIEYADNDGVMLVPNSLPVEGKQNIINRLMQLPDTTYVLTWQPSKAFVAASGEMGFTFGLWNLATKDDSGQPAKLQGTYVTIWKKNKTGKWKFVLDSGNEGLKKEEQ